MRTETLNRAAAEKWSCAAAEKVDTEKCII